MEHSMDKFDQKSSRWKCILLGLLFVAMVIGIVTLSVLLANMMRSHKSNVSDGSDDIVTKAPTAEVKSRTGQYRLAAVAADAEICSQIATDILSRPGATAVDAAIAGMVCVGAVHPQSCGLGGGFLMTIYHSTNGSVNTLVSREVAPSSADRDMYVNVTASASTVGGSAVAVPGEIAGYYEAWQRYGNLPWASLFQPTIRLCEEGIPVTHSLASAIDSTFEKHLKSQTKLWDIFSRDGRPLKEGAKMVRQDLARTLTSIAQDGAEFYTGALADDVVKDLNEIGSNITLADLRAYAPAWKPPVHIRLQNGNYTVYGPPPPSGALVLQYILNILDGYNISAADREDQARYSLTYHRVVEAMKFAFGKRSHLGDEDFVNVMEWKTKLMSAAYGAETRGKIHDDKTMLLNYYEHAYDIQEDHGTSHLSVLDQSGSAVAITSTINLHFGCKRMGSRTGIIFNNEMDDFSTPDTANTFGVRASPANYIVPGKRPMSSMSPTIVLDGSGEVIMVTGASGGTRIITGIAMTMFQSLWLDLELGESLDAARVHHQLLPPYVRYEDALPKALSNGLRSRGHNMSAQSVIGSVVQAIHSHCPEQRGVAHPPGLHCLLAACDRRKGGAPDGY